MVLIAMRFSAGRWRYCEQLVRLKQCHQAVFFDVLHQIKLGEGFDVDSETMEWVERELAQGQSTHQAFDPAD